MGADPLEVLSASPRTWLVTGAAGFIGSHIVERLLGLGQTVRAVDDFSTGHRSNLEAALANAGAAARGFEFVEGTVTDAELDTHLCREVDVVVHQAALGSVPRSVADPLATHHANVNGFLALLDASRRSGVKRFVYASSSSVYGDHPGLPKVEERIGEPLSPYAASKRVDEVYAGTFQRSYGIETIGLRYFNVFGPRQDPDGPYAAVIPRWIAAFLRGETPTIYGDGKTSRDFCPVANVVRANLLAGIAPAEATGRVYNIGLGGRTTLGELFSLLRDGLAEHGHVDGGLEPHYEEFRQGDVRASLADVTAARELLGFEPEIDLATGLGVTLEAFLSPKR